MKDEQIKTDLLEDIEKLDDLLTERIVDLHDAKGWVQCRHVYIYYRSILWDIKENAEKLTK